MPSLDYATESMLQSGRVAMKLPGAGTCLGMVVSRSRNHPAIPPACVASTSTVSRIRHRLSSISRKGPHRRRRPGIALTSRSRAWAMTLVSLQPSAQARGTAALLHRLVCAATTALHLAGAVVTLKSADDAEAIAAATDPTSRARAELEFSVGEGPAHVAFTQRQTGTRRRSWGPSRAMRGPAMPRLAAPAGIGAVFAFPLQVGASRFGVLSLFADAPTTSRTRPS